MIIGAKRYSLSSPHSVQMRMFNSGVYSSIPTEFGDMKSLRKCELRILRSASSLLWQSSVFIFVDSRCLAPITTRFNIPFVKCKRDWNTTNRAVSNTKIAYVPCACLTRVVVHCRSRLSPCVTCSSRRRIDTLSLSNSGVSGTIPTEIAFLRFSLDFLDLTKTALTGPIPSEIGMCRSLRECRWRAMWRHVYWSTTCAHTHTLFIQPEYAYLFANSLSGAIPSEIGLTTTLGTPLPYLWHLCTIFSRAVLTCLSYTFIFGTCRLVLLIGKESRGKHTNWSWSIDKHE